MTADISKLIFTEQYELSATCTSYVLSPLFFNKKIAKQTSTAVGLFFFFFPDREIEDGAIR